MIKINIDGKEVNIKINGRLMDIVRDVVIAIDHIGDAIAESDENGARFFNQTLSVWTMGKSVGVDVAEIMGKLLTKDNDNTDDEKVTVDDLIKDLKEHEEHK